MSIEHEYLTRIYFPRNLDKTIFIVEKKNLINKNIYTARKRGSRLYKRLNLLKTKKLLEQRTKNADYIFNYYKSKKPLHFIEFFNTYTHSIKPVLAYFIVRRRSYRRKRKISKVRYEMKWAKNENQIGKAYHILKAVYYKERTPRNSKSVKRSSEHVLRSEVLKTPNTYLSTKKNEIFNRYGRDALNEVLLRHSNR